MRRWTRLLAAAREEKKHHDEDENKNRDGGQLAFHMTSVFWLIAQVHTSWER